MATLYRDHGGDTSLHPVTDDHTTPTTRQQGVAATVVGIAALVVIGLVIIVTVVCSLVLAQLTFCSEKSLNAKLVNCTARKYLFHASTGLHV